RLPRRFLIVSTEVVWQRLRNRARWKRSLFMLDRSSPNFADLEALLGQAPVLRTEGAKLYDKIRGRFMACFRPDDAIQWWLVDRLVNDAWLIKRYSRHQTARWNAGTNRVCNFKRNEGNFKRT